MSAMTLKTVGRRFDGGRTGLLVARILLLAWAGFWLWFNVASMIGESDGFVHHLTLAAITLGVGVLAWFRPRVGGVMLIAAGVMAASAFPNPWALGLLAIPAAAIGVVMLLASPRM